MKMTTIVLTPDKRVNRADAARFLGVSVKMLSERHRRGLPPQSVKVGSRRFYYLADLQAFIKGRGI